MHSLPISSSANSKTNQASDIDELLTFFLSGYFDSVRHKIPQFVNQHYRYPGAWHINKKALGWDLLKMPCNLIWAPFYLLILLCALLCDRLGQRHLASVLRKVPTGFTTRVQKELAQRIKHELFNEDELVAHFKAAVQHQEELNSGKQLVPLLNGALAQYATTRTASADITNTLFATATGALLLKKFTPGGLAFGIILAGFLAKYQATSTFIFGETLGRLYYDIFPPEPNIGLVVGSTLLIMCLFAMIAALSGLLTDPLQSVLGLHKKRLNKLVDHLQHDIHSALENSTYHPKDAYVARIMELFDAIKTHVS